MATQVILRSKNCTMHTRADANSAVIVDPLEGPIGVLNSVGGGVSTMQGSAMSMPGTCMISGMKISAGSHIAYKGKRHALEAGATTFTVSNGVATVRQVNGLEINVHNLPEMS